MDYLPAWHVEVLGYGPLFLFDFVNASSQFLIHVIHAIVQDFVMLFFFVHFFILLLVPTFHKVAFCALLNALMLVKLFHVLHLYNHLLVDSYQSYFQFKIEHRLPRTLTNLHPCSQINYSLIIRRLPYQKDLR